MAEKFRGKVWKRFDHWVREIRPFVYQVEEPDGRTIGFVTVNKSRYQARSGYGQSVATSEVLGSFDSGAAALRLVIGHHALEQLRDQVKREVVALEQAEQSKPGIAVQRARGRYPGAH